VFCVCVREVGEKKGENLGKSKMDKNGERKKVEKRKRKDMMTKNNKNTPHYTPHMYQITSLFHWGFWNKFYFFHTSTAPSVACFNARECSIHYPSYQQHFRWF
jgi:hypothetical protein